MFIHSRAMREAVNPGATLLVSQFVRRDDFVCRENCVRRDDFVRCDGVDGRDDDK
jgi:hypothetical protein